MVGGGDKKLAEPQEGALSIEFDMTLYTPGTQELIPTESQIFFSKYGQYIDDSEGSPVAFIAYPEIGAPPSIVCTFEPNIPFVLKIDGSPADAVISAIRLMPDISSTSPSFIEGADVTSSYASYFTLASDGTCNITSSLDFYCIKVTVKSTENGKQATFYLLYDV